MHWLTLIFLGALVVQTLVHIWLAGRQISHVTAHRDVVPEAFVGSVSSNDHVRAATYTAARQRVGIIEAVYGSCLLLWLTLGGGIDQLGIWANAHPLPYLPTGTTHLLVVCAVLAAAGLPIRGYRTFRLEQRFGFNRTNARTFILDLLKGWALAAMLGCALIALILWIMAGVGAHWWLLAWAAWVVVTFALALAWPRYIAPLFNQYSQLDDASLRKRIEALLARCGFAAERVFVVDGSRRSSHGNAYFTGLGHTKRVVFFDTLLSTLTPGQVESILAHELAHFKLGHVPQRLAFGALLSLAGFALLAWLAQQPWFQASFGVLRPSDATALLLFMLVSPVFTSLAGPLAAVWSRHHEYQADAFAAQHSSAQDLADALVRLYRDNASTLTPDPVYSAFHDSHPPPAARIARLLSSLAAPPAETAR